MLFIQNQLKPKKLDFKKINPTGEEKIPEFEDELISV